MAFLVLIRPPSCLMPYKNKKDEAIMTQSVEKEHNHFSKLKRTQGRKGLQFPKGSTGMQESLWIGQSISVYCVEDCMLCGRGIQTQH